MNNSYANSAESAEVTRNKPTSAEIQAAIQKNLIQAIPTAALSLGGMYLLLTLAHSQLLAPEHKVFLVPLAGFSALTFFVIFLLTRNDGSPPLYAHSFAGLFGIIGLINSLLHVAITGDPLQSSNIMLTIVAIGAFFLSRNWFRLILISAIVGWSAIAFTSELSDTWIHFAIGMVMSLIVAVVINRIRLKTHNSLFSLHIQQERQREQLEEIQHSLEERVEERTLELNDLNSSLQGEMQRRQKTAKALKTSQESLLEQRNTLQLQVTRQTEQLQIANQRLLEMDKLKSTMLDDIRYEIHPQLNEIKGRVAQLEISLRSSLSDRQGRLFEEIETLAGNLEKSVNSMRTISRMKSTDVKDVPDIKKLPLGV